MKLSRVSAQPTTSEHSLVELTGNHYLLIQNKYCETPVFHTGQKIHVKLSSKVQNIYVEHVSNHTIAEQVSRRTYIQFMNENKRHVQKALPPDQSENGGTAQGEGKGQ